MTANEITDSTGRVLHTVKDVAKFLSVEEQTVKRYLKAGLVYVTLGDVKTVRITSSALADFIKTRGE